ncbi:hypothetical protein Tco_0056241, partial [Tanacetum coccineum]
MWHDIWWGYSPLSSHVSEELIRENELNMNVNVKVAEMIHKNVWKWPDKWKSEKPMIADILVPRLNTNNPDTTIWITKKMPYKKSIRSIVRRLCLAACVYFIWNERNRTLFANERIGAEDVYKALYNTVRLKLSSLKVKRSIQSVKVE